MNCSEIIREIPLYCYGEVTSEVEEQVESHVEACAACKRELERHRLFLERVDDRCEAVMDANLLATCRMDLRRKLQSRPTWFDTLRHASKFSILFRVPVGAMALIAIGYLGARYTAQPMFSSVKSVEAGAAGQVNIAVDEVRRHVVSGSMQDPKIQALLLNAVREESNPGVRVESIGMLHNTADSEKVRSVLIYALTHDPDAKVRLKALEGLKSYAGNAEVRSTLANVLLKDDNPNVRIQAIDLLSTHHDDSIVGVLQNAVQKEDNTYVRAQCSKLLEQMKASVGTY